MSKRSLHLLRDGVVLTALCLSTTCIQAETSEISARIERLEPTQQRQLQALIASRQDLDSARLFSDEEVRAVRATVPVTSVPLQPADIERLSSHIYKKFGASGIDIYRVVDKHNVVFSVCLDCPDGLSQACHDPSSKLRRFNASNLLKQHPHLAEAVGGLYLVSADLPPRLIGTFFVLQGHIVTDVHVVLDHTQPAGPVDVRKAKPGRGLVAVLGSAGGRKVELSATALWRRHQNLDLILTAWPAGAIAPLGLTLAMEPLGADTVVGLLGFPTVNTNTDPPADIDTAFGRCPGARISETRMAISLGRITSVSGADLEHDANTMGNSSGSPLFRTSDGALVGVHTGDSKKSNRNSAVVASVLVELIKDLAR